MDRDRAMRVWTSVALCAKRRGEPLTPAHACLACVDALAVSGAALVLASDYGTTEPVYLTGAGAKALAELQTTLGEGPGIDAIASGTPVMAGDLGSVAAAGRWPVFAPEAARRGTKSIYSVPLALGALRIGALDLYRDDPGEPDREELMDAVVYADTALLLVLDDLGGIPTPSEAPEHAGRPVLWQAEVHQAAGIVSVQLGVPVLDALVRLRAHAFGTGDPLSEVARAVVERRLRLENGSNGFHRRREERS
ncbi:ANTAR domain-containing protein [Amycolatopsis alkalitolerans]|uniref:GAF and ANTAR domain-containing protein n=1 Tax=Amycolatopsis alkalitolerans TaxID=2547244 RepID=A0A5C4LTA0_9PSEU|nr:ANTAR domain-containing protein [Amycolatopsis alkalitolerans]TNC21828.1 GAF and ANTAR domain-containing protein [Amycolatopsis alkalitolerans]